jgi:hypothetical protein
MNDHVIPKASALIGWRRSSYSGPEGGSCLEVLDGWRKSTYSGNDGADCLEVRDGDPCGIPVRDSKVPHGPAVVFSPSSWTAFVSAVKAAEIG